MTVVKQGMTVPQCEAVAGLVACADGSHSRACTGPDYCCCCLTGPTGFRYTCCCYDKVRPPSGCYRLKMRIPKRMGFHGPLGSGIVMSLGSRGAKPCAPVRPCVLESGVDTWVVCTLFLAVGVVVRTSVKQNFEVKKLILK